MKRITIKNFLLKKFFNDNIYKTDIYNRFHLSKVATLEIRKIKPQTHAYFIIFFYYQNAKFQ